MPDSEIRGKLTINPMLLRAMQVVAEDEKESTGRILGTLIFHAPLYRNELARRLRIDPEQVEKSLGVLMLIGLVELDEPVEPILYSPSPMGRKLCLLAREIPAITFTRGR